MKQLHLYLILLSLNLFSFSELYACRPLATDDAGTVSKGTYELEIGYDFEKNTENSDYSNFSFCLKHGLTERLDLGVSFPVETTPEKGFGEAEIVTKFAILRKENIPEFSLTFTFYPGTSVYALNGILSKDFGKFITHFNLGYLTSNNSSEKITTNYSGAIDLPISEKFNLFFELVGESNSDENILEFLIGGSYKISESILFDTGLSKIINASNQVFKTTCGITHSF